MNVDVDVNSMNYPDGVLQVTAQATDADNQRATRTWDFLIDAGTREVSIDYLYRSYRDEKDVRLGSLEGVAVVPPQYLYNAAIERVRVIDKAIALDGGVRMYHVVVTNPSTEPVAVGVDLRGSKEWYIREAWSAHEVSRTLAPR